MKAGNRATAPGKQQGNDMQRQEPTAKIVQRRAGPAYRLANNLITVKVTAADTRGYYALFEISSPPGQGMPTHRRRYDDESLWVLQGRVRLAAGDDEVELGAGGYAFVPRGIARSFTNNGAEEARLLSLVTPGGIQERFIAEAGERVAEPAGDSTAGAAQTWSDIAAIAQKYGIDILPPAEKEAAGAGADSPEG
jgi:quercetin dioxygenase-like cupin family protein